MRRIGRPRLRRVRRQRDPQILQVLLRSLRADFKSPDRFDLIAKELNAGRIDVRRPENIENPAPQREVPRLLHLIKPLEPAIDQVACESFRIARLADAERNGVSLK